MNQPFLIVAIGACLVAGAVLTNFYLVQDEDVSPKRQKVEPPIDTAKNLKQKKERVSLEIERKFLVIS